MKRQSKLAIADYPYTVASTWSLSFEQVEQECPAAAELLRLCAFLDPDAIPETIITEGSKFLGSVLEPVATDPLLLNEAIQTFIDQTRSRSEDTQSTPVGPGCTQRWIG